MKQILSSLVIACFFNYTVSGQSTNQNFVKKTIPLSPVSTETALNLLGTPSKVESINYINGLGRPLQDVIVKGSPGANDLIQPYMYDQYGRQSMTFLPYTDATASGTYRNTFFTSQADFYTNQTMVAKTAYPYSETVFDNSPLNVVREKSAPDADWQLGNGHTSQAEYSFNPDPNEDVVMMWDLQANGDYTCIDIYYPQNTLYTKKITDPNGNYSIIYSDKTGKIICSKQFLETRYYNGNSYPYYLITYMIYDDFGQLVVVIPPKAMELMDASQNYSVNGLTQDLVYRYVYDQRNRLIEKKAPGIGWQYFVYNQLDQPVLFRDANLQAQNKWGFIKYDVLGRPILSGLMNASGLFSYQSRALAQAVLDGTQTVFGESREYESVNAPFGYTNVSLPNQNLEILTVNYYDDYDFNKDGTPDYNYNSAAIPCFAFNATAYNDNHANQLMSQTTVGSVSTDLTAALAMSGSSTTLTNLLNQAVSLKNSLTTLMSTNVSNSAALLTAENPVTLSALQASLDGITATRITQLDARITQCISSTKNADMLTLLNGIKTKTATLSSNNALSITLIGDAINSCSPYANIAANRTRGYLTGTKVKVLDATNPVQWEIGVVFYDDDGQAIQSQSNDHMGGTDLINLVYDFAGNMIHSQQLHTSPGQPNIEVLNHMSFDKMGRLLRVDQKNNQDHAVMLSKYNYNELSQLIDKKVHSLNDGNSFLQSMDFRYNVQGWLSSVNNIDLSNDLSTNPTIGKNDDTDDLWGMELSYNTPFLGGPAQYNGNVSEKKWRSVDYSKRSYKYEYDKLDRLKSSSYAEFSAFTGWNVSVGKYDEKDITYDANGNIKTLKRYGFQSATSTFGLIDNLSYQYNGNFLTAITDASSTHGTADFKDNGSTISNGEYSYDGNGNLTGNLNKSISNITYNHLNLPVQITFYNGNKIEYTYDAIGTRLRKKAIQGSTVTTKQYAGSFEYNTNNLLESMQTTEGRCVTTGSSPEFRYEYQYLDNTGNVMMAFSDMDFDNVINPSTEVLQQNHYYSFGMRMEGTNAPFVGVENKYKFSGKELDDELGLNEYDFGARMYDPAIARWGCFDPMADLAPHWTPFRYSFNNPVNVTDPSGMAEVSDQVGGGLDYSAASTSTLTPEQIKAAADAQKDCPTCKVEFVGKGISVTPGGGTATSTAPAKSAAPGTASGTSPTTPVAPKPAEPAKPANQAKEPVASNGNVGAVTTFAGNALDGMNGTSIGGKSDGAVDEEPKQTTFEKIVGTGSKFVSGASAAQSAADKMLKEAKRDNGAQKLSKLINKYRPTKKHVGTQQAKKLLEKGGKILGKVGKVLTRVGTVFQAIDIGYKLYNKTVKTSDVAAVITTGLSLAFPVFGAIWGAASFFNLIMTGKTLEEALFD
jgi:RHS repeat-associated protein